VFRSKERGFLNAQALPHANGMGFSRSNPGKEFPGPLLLVMFEISAKKAVPESNRI